MDSVLLIVTAIVLFCSALSWFFMKMSSRRLSHWNTGVTIFISGFLPTVLIVLILVVLHIQAYAEYMRGPQEGFMGPLLFLVYGFPYVVINLVLNFVAAGFARNRT